MAADTPRVRAAMRSLCHELDGQRPGLASLVANALELSLAMRGASSLPPSCTASLPADEDAAGLTAALAQLSEFAGSFEAKVARSVVEPLQSLQASADAATRLARAFDDESEALDAAQRGYLGLSRDSPLEARAAALQEVHAHRASVSVSLMSAGAALREARGAAAWAPRRAVAQLLVAQLAFHQSCARVLAAQVPRLSAMIQTADEIESRYSAASRADEAAMSRIPRPRMRDASAPSSSEGWIYLQMPGVLTRAEQAAVHTDRAYVRRWFSLDFPGLLSHHKSRDDALRTPAIALDLRTPRTTACPLANPCAFQIQVGGGTLCLRAPDETERTRWMLAISACLGAAAVGRGGRDTEVVDAVEGDIAGGPEEFGIPRPVGRAGGDAAAPGGGAHATSRFVAGVGSAAGEGVAGQTGQACDGAAGQGGAGHAGSLPIESTLAGSSCAGLGEATTTEPVSGPVEATTEFDAGRRLEATTKPIRIEGWLQRQDADRMRRWRRWWCEVAQGQLICTLFDSLRVSDPPPSSTPSRYSLAFPSSFPSSFPGSSSAPRRVPPPPPRPAPPPPPPPPRAPFPPPPTSTHHAAAPTTLSVQTDGKDDTVAANDGSEGAGWRGGATGAGGDEARARVDGAEPGVGQHRVTPAAAAASTHGAQAVDSAGGAHASGAAYITCGSAPATAPTPGNSAPPPTGRCNPATHPGGVINQPPPAPDPRTTADILVAGADDVVNGADGSAPRGSERRVLLEGAAGGNEPSGSVPHGVSSGQHGVCSSRTHTASGGEQKQEEQEASQGREVSPPPLRPLSRLAFPLATLAVREARGGGPPFCFEAIAPSGSVVLQAAAQDEMEMWIQVLQNGIESSLGSLGRRSSASSHSPALSIVRAVAGNASCADCGAADPTWASVNLGITICLACAGAHRRLGTHLSKVRSLELDTRQWSPVQLALMCKMGNIVSNSIFAPRPPSAPAPRLEPGAPPGIREAHVRAKYELRAFSIPAGGPAAPHALHRAAAGDDAPALLAALAAGADLEGVAGTEEAWQEEAAGGDAGVAAVGLVGAAVMGGGSTPLHPPVPVYPPAAAGLIGPATPRAAGPTPLSSAHRGRRPLHVAASEGRVHALELLLLNGAAADAEDGRGKTALRLAVEGGHALVVAALLTRGANISHADGAGVTPIGAAQDLGHDEIMQAMLSYKLAQDEKLLAQVISDGHHD